MLFRFYAKIGQKVDFLVFGPQANYIYMLDGSLNLSDAVYCTGGVWVAKAPSLFRFFAKKAAKCLSAFKSMLIFVCE